MDTLYCYYVQSKKYADVVGNIINQINESGHKMKSRVAVIQVLESHYERRLVISRQLLLLQQLLQQDIIPQVEFDDLMKFEDSQCQGETKTFGSTESPKEESGIDVSDHSDVSVNNNQLDDIKVQV